MGKVGKGFQGVEEAIGKFANDPDQLTKIDVAVSLASLGKVDDSVIPAMLEALGSKEEETAKGAARILADIGAANPDKVLPGLMAAVDKGEDPLSRNSVRVLRQMKTQAMPALPRIAGLYDKVDQSTRVEITEALRAIDAKGDYAIPVMIKALGSSDSKDRHEALMGLYRFRTKVELVIDPLIGALKDPDTENQFLAVRILRGIGPQAMKAVPSLVQMTESSNSNLRIRNAAIEALSSFTPPTREVLDALDKAVKDGDMDVRLHAVGSLRRIGYLYPDQVTPLLKSGLEVASDERTKNAINSALERLKSGTGKASTGEPSKREGKQLPSG
ncbi:MAG: HEAT repeat domain-containing protein [Desulfomonile tiedjei]|nr:HEAT repeat domain-containing protein [Desulfomonile tiedjei]